MRKIYFLAGLLLAISSSAFSQAQDASPRFKKALQEYNSLRYVPAIELLKRVVKAEPKNKLAKEMLANSYRNIKNYNEALVWYSRLYEEGSLKAQQIFNYAEVLANKGEYEKAEQLYKRYQQSTYNNTGAANYLKAFPNLGKLMRNTNDWVVNYLNINTAAAEYAPAFYNGGLMFTSNRETPRLTKKVFGWDATPFSNLFFVKDAKSVKGINPDSVLKEVKKKPELYKKVLYKFNDDDTDQTSNDNRTVAHINSTIVKDTLGHVLSNQVQVEPFLGKINSNYHEAASVLLPDGSILFTRNNYYNRKTGTSKQGINKLKIYQASGTNFEQITPFAYNSDEYSVGHPAISKDGKLLIFASDMPGGQGGSDLYYCTRESVTAAWSKPVNMGKEINTEGNELFPFLSAAGKLVFCSTGHFGLGGLDLFHVDLNGTTPKSAPINFGSPVNSSVDDFAAVLNEDGKSGYFSSNRRGNDDIYSFVSKPYVIKLAGLVIDAASGKPIANSAITLTTEEKQTKVYTDADGKFLVSLEKYSDYAAEVLKESYLNFSSSLTTNGIAKDSTISVTYKLEQPKRQEVMVNCDSIRKAFAVHNIYYDLDKSTIRPDALPALNHVVNLLKEHPTISVVAASHCDLRASEEYNIKLSLRRSNAVRDYLISHGISPKRIKAEYYGKSRVAVEGDETSEEVQRLNRRTEFFVIANGVNVTLRGCLK